MLFVLHVVVHVVAVTINPADAAVLAQMEAGGNGTISKLDRNKHKHAIENSFCHLCQLPV